MQSQDAVGLDNQIQVASPRQAQDKFKWQAKIFKSPFYFVCGRLQIAPLKIGT